MGVLTNRTFRIFQAKNVKAATIHGSGLFSWLIQSRQCGAYRREYKGHQLRKKGFSTKAAAENHLTDAMKDVDAAERGEIRLKPSTVLDAYNLYKEQQTALMERKGYRYACAERSNLKTIKEDFVDVVGADKHLRLISIHEINQFASRITFVRDERGKVVTEDGQPIRRMQPQSVQNRLGRLFGMLRLAQRALPDMATWQVPYLKLPKVRVNKIRTVKPAEYATLLATLDNPPRSSSKFISDMQHAERVRAWRDAADWVRLLYATGARCQEILFLERSQVNWEAVTVHIYASKTETERDMPMSDDMMRTLRQREVDGLADETMYFPRARKPGYINMLEKHVRNAALIAGLDYGRSKPRTAVSKSTAAARLKGVNYSPKRADGCHGFTLHSFRHTFISDMLRALSGDAKAVMELSGHSNYESFQCYLHAEESTMEIARNVIKNRDGNLTGSGVNGVAEVTGVAQSATPTPVRKRPLAPAAKAVLE